MKTLKAVGLFNLAIIIISILFIASCNNDEVTNSTYITDPYEIKVWDYSDKHYFLDTVYKSSFLDYYNNISISSQTNSLIIDDQSFEVWVQTDVVTSNYRKAGMHVDLSILPSGGYNDSLKSVPNPEQGIRTFGLVKKLMPSEYVLNKFAGYVSLKIDLPDNYFAGVAYKRSNTGEQFGSISTDTIAAPNDTLVLKMVKVQNLIPQNTLAWEMRLKNIYQFPDSNVKQEGFELYVKYLSNGLYEEMLPINNLSTHLTTILGLDKYSAGRTGSPNNVFDFLAGYTIDQENGWLIFPTLEPFLNNLSSYNLNGVTIDSTYWYPQIYEELKSNSNQVPNANNYKITGNISR